MDTHLTPINEDVIREREDAMRLAHERATTTATTRSTTTGGDTVTDGVTQSPPAGAGAARRVRGGADLLVVTLFAVLAAGFVSLVVTTLRV